MNLLSQKIFYVFSFLICFLSTWIIIGAIPSLQLDGMFKQVDTQIFFLHVCGSILYFYKAIEIYFNRNKASQLNNTFFLILFCIGILSLFSSLFNDVFFLSLMGSSQIGQGTLWYFNFAILTLCFTPILENKKVRIFFLFNILVLISIVTIFTIHPYWKGFKITFFYFTDYLCYFGILTFIIFTSIINDKRLILFAYCILGYYLNLLDNKAAMILWGFVFLLGVSHQIFTFYDKYLILKKLKLFFYSNLFLVSTIALGSILILISSLILWPGDGALPERLQASNLSSLVVRGKVLEIAFSDFLNVKNLLFGEGWGKISDLLLAQMNAWQYDQLTVGFNLHFHTHNEFAEHFISIGFFGVILFLVLIYYTFKEAERISVYNKLGWLLFYYVSCFWFFWAGTLPIIALALASLGFPQKSIISNKIFDHLKTNTYIPIIFLVTLGLLLAYGSWLSFSYTQEFKKISFGSLASFSNNQELKDIKCENYYTDRKGGETIIPFMNTFPRYIMREEIDNTESYVKVVEMIQCLAEQIIYNSQPKLHLITGSILLDTKMFYSSSEVVKNLYSSEEKYENLKKKIFLLIEKAPVRGDLIMPFIAISLKKNKLHVVEEICEKKEVRGINGYCNLFYAYKHLNSPYPSRDDIRKSIDYLSIAVEDGILEERIYGWWFTEELLSNVQNYTPEGIPISPNIIFYINTGEALKLLNILKNFE